MSLFDKIRSHTPKGLILGASMLGMIAMGGCDSILGNKKKKDDPFVNTPSEISFSPLQGRVGEPYVGKLNVSDVDGIQKVEVLGADSTWSYNASGNNFSVDISKEFKNSGERSLLFKVTDTKGDVTQKGVVLNVLPVAYVNTPPTLDLTYESNGIDRADFRIKASDNRLVDRLEIDFGNGFESILVNKSEIDTIISRMYGRDGGSFNFNVRALDDEGASTQKAASFDLTGRADLNLEWRTYFDELPIDGAKIYLNHQSGLLDTVLTTQNGVVNGLDLPKGEYKVLLHANPSTILPSKDGEFISNISRMRIPNRDFLPEEYWRSFWHGRGDTYVVSGPAIRSNQSIRGPPGHILESYFVFPSEVRFNFLLNRDLSTLVETLENPYSQYPITINGRSGGYLLEEISRQTSSGTGMVNIPKVDEPLIFVHNWGDKNCADNWNSVVDLICTPGLLPGVMAFEQDKQNFDIFFNDLMSIMNDPKIGGNPYDVRKLVGYSEDISGEIIIDPENYHSSTFYGGLMRDKIKDGVVYSGHTGGGTSRELFVRNRGPPYYIDRSLANVVNNSVPSIFSNEMTIFAPNESRLVLNPTTGEWVLQPIFGSVRDPPALLSSLGYDYRHPEYGVVPGNTTFHKKDVYNIKALLGFATYAQNQYLYEDVRDVYGNKTFGFMLHLHHRYVDD